MHKTRIDIGMDVSVARLRSVEGIVTRPEYLSRRRLGVTGKVLGFPAGYAGALWKVQHQDTGHVAVYFPSELVQPADLENALAEAGVKSMEFVVPDLDQPDCISIDAPIRGEITDVSADMLVATVSSWAQWRNGINQSLQECASTYFHDQLPQSLRNLDTYMALGDATTQHLPFKDVLFVVDDCETSVSELVLKALHFADDQMVECIALPIISFVPGRESDAGTVLQLIGDFYGAVAAFAGSNPQHVRRIKIIVPALKQLSQPT